MQYNAEVNYTDYVDYGENINYTDYESYDSNDINYSDYDSYVNDKPKVEISDKLIELKAVVCNQIILCGVATKAQRRVPITNQIVESMVKNYEVNKHVLYWDTVREKYNNLKDLQDMQDIEDKEVIFVAKPKRKTRLNRLLVGRPVKRARLISGISPEDRKGRKGLKSRTKVK